MKIRVRYFASLRELTGQSEETFTLEEEARVMDARAALIARYPAVQPILERSVYAVNRSYVPLEATLHEGDELVFIPPMGGGQ
jgi:molybdopterin synthase sulfur carrier subunit